MDNSKYIVIERALADRIQLHAVAPGETLSELLDFPWPGTDPVCRDAYVFRTRDRLASSALYAYAHAAAFAADMLLDRGDMEGYRDMRDRADMFSAAGDTAASEYKRLFPNRDDQGVLDV